MRLSNVPFNFWFVHTPPGGHVVGTSGDCNFNIRRKVKWLNVPHIQGAPLSPILEYGLSKHDTLNQWCCTFGPASVTPAQILTSKVDPCAVRVKKPIYRVWWNQHLARLWRQYFVSLQSSSLMSLWSNLSYSTFLLLNYSFTFFMHFRVLSS